MFKLKEEDTHFRRYLFAGRTNALRDDGNLLGAAFAWELVA